MGETIIAMKKQTDDEKLENVYDRQLQQSEHVKPLLSLYIQDTVQKGASRDNTRLQKRVVRYLDQKVVRSISLPVKDYLKSPPLALLLPRARIRAQEREPVEIACSEQQKVNALEEVSVDSNAIQRGEKPEKRQGFADRPALHDGIPWKG